MLFESYSLGSLTLSNRVVMAPMTRSRAAVDHTPTPIMADYYAQRASAGLLITEGTAPSPNGVGYARIPGIWSVEQAEAWKPVTEAVHQSGGVIAVQLMHTGRVSHPANMPTDARVLAPSAVPLTGEMYTDAKGNQTYPTATPMADEDIASTIEEYAQSCRLAMDAGFDLVELHGANGYLIDQFLSVPTNTRTDGWGGSAEGRGRFAVEVSRACAAAIGPERVGIRLSPFGVFNGIKPWASVEEDFVWVAQALGELGLAYIHLVDHSAMGAPEVPASTKSRLQAAFGGPIILSGGYFRNSAEADLAAGKGDLVAFGRPFIANPDLVERMEAGSVLNAPDQTTFYTPGEKGYTDYPSMGE